MSDEFPPFPEDLLVEAAMLGVAWSREWCRHVTPSGETCAGYHGPWQFLRLFDIAHAVTNDAAFFRDAFGAAARRGARRVLVAGCADFAMAAAAQWAFRREGVEPEIVAIDICETPVRLNRWYAERTGATLAAEAANVLDYRPERPFDVVCTHSALGLFAPETRPALAARWRELLVPGGLFATVSRVAPGAPDLERFAPAQARDFRDNMLRAWAARRDRLRLPRESDMAALIDAYIAQNAVYPVRSQAVLRELMESGGFRVELLAPRVPPAVRNLSGPTLIGGSTIVQLAAI
ncbi:MAG: class I SAM-dependent methyltransferase, partial [Stellaceae bacterium]